MQNNLYRTKDAQIAAMLYTKGQHLADVERINGTCFFVFENARACEDLARNFWKKGVNGNLKDFSDAMRTVKDLIFSN